MSHAAGAGRPCRMTTQTERIVVIGGGYAGATAAIRLAGKARRRAQVTLVDPDGTLLPRLRLHQIAVGQEIRAPQLAVLGRRRIEVVRGHATGIDLAAGQVEVGRQTLGFDRLILANGSTIERAAPGAAEHAHALDGMAGALRLRAALAKLPAKRVLAVIGGGMTGLETVTEIAEARPDLHVRLITGGALGGYLSAAGRGYLERSLSRLGIEVVDRARVTALEPDRARLADGAEVPFALAVWCGGFIARPLAREAGLAVDARGCVLLDAELRSLSHPHVLAAGDAGAPPDLPNGARYRMTCQAGMPAGAHAADTVAAQLAGREPAPFSFGYIHMPISLGRRDGLIQWVERNDALKPTVLTGRRAALYKNAVTGSPALGLRLERRFPGALRGPRARPVRTAEPVTA
jgi:NADH:ubiquinone reductase (H+-translocating)